MKQFVVLSALFIMLTGCKSKVVAVSEQSLAATAWEVSQIGGKPAKQADYNRGLPGITFTGTSKISGHGGCNGYSGEYALGDNGSFTIGKVMATKMYCEGDGEANFMKMLAKANTVKIVKNQLIMLSGETEVLVFVPKSK